MNRKTGHRVREVASTCRTKMPDHVSSSGYSIGILYSLIYIADWVLRGASQVDRCASGWQVNVETRASCDIASFTCQMLYLLLFCLVCFVCTYNMVHAALFTVTVPLLSVNIHPGTTVTSAHDLPHPKHVVPWVLSTEYILSYHHFSRCTWLFEFVPVVLMTRKTGGLWDQVNRWMGTPPQQINGAMVISDHTR